LEECSISFTGIVPHSFPISASRTWKIAQSCGATCQEEITEETTHLVCNVCNSDLFLRTSSLKLTLALTLMIDVPFIGAKFDRAETLKVQENLHTWGLFIVDQSWVHESAKNGKREWELFHSRHIPRIWVKVGWLNLTLNRSTFVTSETFSFPTTILLLLLLIIIIMTNCVDPFDCFRQEKTSLEENFPEKCAELEKTAKVHRDHIESAYYLRTTWSDLKEQDINVGDIHEAAMREIEIEMEMEEEIGSDK
jgi:hypothetical protein